MCRRNSILGGQNVGQLRVLDIAHEQPIAILCRKIIRKIDSRTTVCRKPVLVRPDCLDVIVDMWIDMGATLLRVNPALHNMVQVRDHAACHKTLTVVIEVKSPRIR